MLNRRIKRILINSHFWLGMSLLYLFVVLSFIILGFFDTNNSYSEVTSNISQSIWDLIAPKYPRLDKIDYDERLLALANMPEIIKTVSTSSTSTKVIVSATSSNPTPKVYQTFWGKIK